MYKAAVSGYSLDKKFVQSYRNSAPSFGFGVLSDVVYRRTYSRTSYRKTEGGLPEECVKELFYETIERVINGTFTMMNERLSEVGTCLPEDKDKFAKSMYDKIFNFKFSPPGRGFWAHGTDLVLKKKLYPALNNCAFVSTENIEKEGATPFLFAEDQLMLGLGVGFDTRGAGKIQIKAPTMNSDEILDKERLIEQLSLSEKTIYEREYIRNNTGYSQFLIPDTREGWVQATGRLINSYFRGEQAVVFDYSQIRKNGEPLKTFGGVSAGPAPLMEVHSELRRLLDADVGTYITVTRIVDIFNLIARAVIAGNIRRSSQIALSELTDEFTNLKNYEVNPERSTWSWCSNNSVILDPEDRNSIHRIVDNIKRNGEPGILWLKNAQEFSRMCDERDYKDVEVTGTNPCSEQSLSSYEICCLSEIFLDRHSELDDFLDTVKHAYIYAKTVTLGESNWKQSTEIINRNRRIGVSLTGISQFVTRNGKETLKEWCKKGYEYITQLDNFYSDEIFKVNRSIKLTTVKPSGTVSLLSGSSPGSHYPICGSCYIRRVRMEKNSPLIPPLREAGYHIEPDVFSSDTTLVVSFPILTEDDCPSSKDVSIEEKIKLTALLQKYWSDNQVSVTIDFNKEEGERIPELVNKYSRKLKSISFLPQDPNSYPQMVYEEISRDVYEEMVKNIKPVVWNDVKYTGPDKELDRLCDGGVCMFK